MLNKLGYGVARHPIITIVTWLLASVLIGVIALGGFFGQSLFERLSNDQPSVSGESTTADNLLEGPSGEKTESIIIVLDKATLDNEELATFVNKMSNELKEIKNVESVVTPIGLPTEALLATPELAGLVSNDNDSVLVMVSVKQEAGSTKENSEIIHETVDTINTYIPEFKTMDVEPTVVNQTLVSDQISHQASEDLKKGELISLPLALIFLILVFGGFLAAGLPLIGAGVSIIGGLGVLFGASYVLNVDTTVLNVVTVIGLGLSIDYGLLMVSRFREILRELPYGDQRTVRMAVAKTLSTAGKTVLFSGLTVAICTSSLVLFEAGLMKSIAVATAAVIVIAILASLTLLPAIFALMGYKLIKPSPLTRVKGLGTLMSKFGDVAPAEGFFTAIAKFIQKAPILVFIAGAGVLLFLGSSILSLHVSNFGTPYLAKSTGQVKAFEDLADNYNSFAVADITVLVKGDGAPAVETANEYYANLQSNKQVSEVFSPQANFENGYVEIKANATDNVKAHELVAELRTDIVSNGDKGDVLITGNAARDIDFNNSLLNSAWLVAGIIALTTFILLFLMTGSLLIPIKAILLSVLSLGASIGVITWGFEGGHLSGLLNFDASQIVGISPIILVLIIVFGFGLAMDYEVFLVSRIKEEWDKSKNNKLAIQKGLQGSGRIITSAGLIVVLVFLGFAFGDMLMIKQIGVALAVAVLVDMTIVRCLLVPAVMSMFGKYTWWAPKWMKKIYEKAGFSH